MGDNSKKNEYWLAKHDSFTLASYDFKLETLKVLFGTLFKANSSFIEPDEINQKGKVIGYSYCLDLEEIKSLVGIEHDFENSNRKKDSVIEDLVGKVVIFENDKKKKVTGLFQSVTIDKRNKTFEFQLDREVKEYLVDQFKRYTKFGFNHIRALSSKYSIRLYEFLVVKTKYQSNKHKEITFSVERIREHLHIPKSYNYSKFKEQILLKSQNDFIEEGLVSYFKIEELKEKRSGRGRRKIENLVFTFQLTSATEELLKTHKKMKNTDFYKEIEKKCSDFINPQIIGQIFESHKDKPKKFLLDCLEKTIDNSKNNPIKYLTTLIKNNHGKYKRTKKKVEKKRKIEKEHELLQEEIDGKVEKEKDKILADPQNSFYKEAKERAIKIVQQGFTIDKTYKGAKAKDIPISYLKNYMEADIKEQVRRKILNNKI